jgi:O-antigen ligase
MVEQRIAWFRGYGGKTGDARIDVESAAGVRTPVVPPSFKPLMPILTLPSRIELWRAALRLWWQHPLLGIGPDNFRHVYGRALDLDPYDDRIHANSLYFETLADLGVLGVTALAALIVALSRTAMNGWRRARSEERLFVLGLSGALGAFFLHGAVDYFLPFTPTNGLFWLLAGTLVGVSPPLGSKLLNDVELAARQQPARGVAQCSDGE